MRLPDEGIEFLYRIAFMIAHCGEVELTIAPSQVGNIAGETVLGGVALGNDLVRRVYYGACRNRMMPAQHMTPVESVVFFALRWIKTSLSAPSTGGNLFQQRFGLC